MSSYSEQQVAVAINSALSDVNLLNDVRNDPVEAAPRLARATAEQLAAFVGDKWVYRIAVTVLALLTLITAFGAIYLVTRGENIPEVLVALGSASVGALVGLFATPPGK